MADSVRIEQILLNLLSNAAKFSPEGGSISLTGGRQNGYIVIEVHNSGPSIPPEELQGIFQPYYRLKSADEEHVPGVGLGLALCRHLIELHGGEIWVESKQDKGNTFAFTLPIGAVTGEETIRADESSLNHEPQIPDCEFQNPTKILVIEDNPQIVEAISLCFQLRCPEVSVVSATNGNTGIEMVETESPDMVIIDLGLPDIDGFDVLREIRSFSDVPAIILSVRGGEMDKVRGLELGADDYMVKPFNHAELLARVKAVLRRTTMPQLKDAEEVVISSELKIDFASSCLYRKGQTAKLTPNESSLLYHLVRNGGKTLSHRYLLERIWGEEHSDATEYLKVYVQRLRKKLEDDPSQPQMLTTEWGLGYRFIKPAQKTPANRSARAKALLRRKEAVM
jgi:two-component system KDP operon response regulator KdpE